jgi:hypothetical protein
MKSIRILLIALAGTAFMASVAFANPAMLPKHPGYPAKGKSPATGQSTANDQGQGNALGAAAAEAGAASANASSLNTVSDPNRARITGGNGAGRLPNVDGPLNKVKINPAGAKSTVIN